MKFICTGKSLNELYAEYGEGKGGFYSHWWKDEAFANDKPPAGEYELNIEHRTLHNLTYEEQVQQLPVGFAIPHPAVLAEALLSHFKATGEYLMKDWWSRTSLLDSDRYRVYVGRCDAEGVVVDDRDGSVGVGASRKFDQSFEPRSLDPLEPSSLELRVTKLEQAVFGKVAAKKRGRPRKAA
jgi:hypothetical protein